MGKLFDQLPTAWQDTVNKEIADMLGQESPEIAEAFREHWGKYYQEVVLPEIPVRNSIYEMVCTLADFLTGWRAAFTYLEEQQAEVGYCCVVCGLVEEAVEDGSPPEGYVLTRLGNDGPRAWVCPECWKAKH